MLFHYRQSEPDGIIRRVWRGRIKIDNVTVPDMASTRIARASEK